MTVSVVKLDGDLDFSRKPELEQLLSAAESSDIAIIDLQEATYIDSCTLSCLMALKKHMAEGGTAAIVRIAVANNSMKRIFQICGLDNVFDIYESTAQAQAGRPANVSGRKG
jgi:anti-anti-sigma factor